MIAVLDADQILKGIIGVDYIRPMIFGKNNAEQLFVTTLMKPAGVVIYESDSVINLAKKFDDTGLWNLPVIKASGRFSGFISKSSVLDSYRELLQEYSD